MHLQITLNYYVCVFNIGSDENKISYSEICVNIFVYKISINRNECDVNFIRTQLLFSSTTNAQFGDMKRLNSFLLTDGLYFRNI